MQALRLARAGVRSALWSSQIHRTLADAAPAAATDKLLFNFYLPHKAIKKSAHVDMVIVPAASGLMGIMPSHAPTVAQLNAGVLEVHDGAEKESFFVSSGFAFVREDRTDVCAVEAVRLADVDREAVAKGLAECEAAVVSAKDDVERAEAQIGVDVYMSLQGAISMM
jgi:F-type H+-transporting ATPase subunit delta